MSEPKRSIKITDHLTCTSAYGSLQPFPTSKHFGKTLEQKFIFQIGTLNTHGINERFHSTNLFLLSRLHIPTSSVAQFSTYKPTHKPQFLQSLWRRVNAGNVSLSTLYGGQFTFSTQLITLNYLANCLFIFIMNSCIITKLFLDIKFQILYLSITLMTLDFYTFFCVPHRLILTLLWVGWRSGYILKIKNFTTFNNFDYTEAVD